MQRGKRRRNGRRRRLFTAGVALVCLLAGIWIGRFFVGRGETHEAIPLTATDAAAEKTTTDVPASEEKTGASADATQAEGSEALSVAQIARMAWPAVVPVLTQYEGYSRRGDAQTSEGNGSAVYFDKSGLLLTNAHVLEDAVSIRIRTPDGKDAPVVGYAVNALYDLAVLDVGDAMGEVLPIGLGDSSALSIGERVVAIGFPTSGEEMLGETLTVGYVSALKKTNMVSDALPDDYGLIQTDAAINSGNSGGALLNEQGLLVGIPTMKLQSGYGMSFEGLAFAIPVTESRQIVSDLTEEVLKSR